MQIVLTNAHRIDSVSYKARANLDGVKALLIKRLPLERPSVQDALIEVNLPDIGIKVENFRYASVEVAIGGIVIARPSVNMKALQRRRVSIPPKPEVVHICDASQPEHSLLDEYEQRLIKVASTCRQSGSYFSISIVVLSSSALFSAVWSAKLLKQLHDICRQCYYPSLVLAFSSVVAAVGFIIHPIMMFTASVAVSLTFKFWEPIVLETRRLSCIIHETLVQLERYLDNHSSSLERFLKRNVDDVIRILEQRTHSSDAPFDISLHQLLRPMPINTQQVSPTETNGDPKMKVDVEFGHLSSSSWIKTENSIRHTLQHSSEGHLYLDDNRSNKEPGLNEQRATFKIELKRSHADIPLFDSEGWLLINNPELTS
ncbi:hypothetical protein CVT25_015438 [Psilocybe cyanescens]|uniref:Uncharacterized protein n=1 Tax=Psilocybe cyanescens TaxID=93625 RepID=A0A409WHH7_PSICY|nr:hypothetical protein CVT25_015438 [Psilocybe cyanescens]